MRLVEREYEEFPADRFPNMVLARAFADCRVWTAGVELPVIVLAEDTTRRLAVFEYDSPEEREADIARILRMREDEGGQGDGVPARPAPKPPQRRMGAANESTTSNGENLEQSQ